MKSPLAARLSILVAAAATLVLQIAATRVLSAAVSYHSAFVVIGIVMLGLAAAASTVFVHRTRRVRPIGVEGAIPAFLGAGIACVVAGFGFAAVSALAVGAGLGLTVLAAAGLFLGVTWCAGYGISQLLSAFPDDIGRVYWFDLSGAALGCVLALPALDGRSPLVVVLACGAAFAVAGLLLALRPDLRGPAPGAHSLVRVAAAGVVLTTGAWLAGEAVPDLTRLRAAKGAPQTDVLWERWNRLARVTVSEQIPGYAHNLALLRERQPDIDAVAAIERWRIGWGLSSTYRGPIPQTRWVTLDADAGTQIVDGAAWPDQLDVLGYDVTAFAYHLRRDEALDDAFVIGGGGGRDVLTALHFGADEVVAAELNPDVVRAVDEVFADFSGRPYRRPGVALRLGDARSTLMRTDQRFDVLQMSMIDTWAASAAGALVLSENGLYTLEAFRLYLDHVERDGLVSVSRWADRANWGELGRTVALMGAALRERGITDVAAHLAVVQTRDDPSVATCLMRPTPFTSAERAAIDAHAERLGFAVALGGASPEPNTAGVDLARIAAGDEALIRQAPFDLSPSTDDRPFFFNIKWMFSSWVRAVQHGDPSLGSASTAYTLGMLLLLTVIGRLLILEPLERHNRDLPAPEQLRLADHVPAGLYFAGIGLGFMLVEVGVLQRYLVFLGHPTYAMSVVLFSLLLTSGLGAGLSERIEDPRHVGRAVVWLLAIVGLTALAVPSLLQAAHGLSLTGRMAVAVALVAPLGMGLGVMFPLGVRLLARQGLSPLIPWVWAINGLAGVIASVLGMLVAMLWGYTAVLTLGALAYALAGWASRRPWTGA